MLVKLIFYSIMYEINISNRPYFLLHTYLEIIITLNV